MSAYRAPWWLPGGHLQTIFAALAPAPRVPWRREEWATPDGDFIDLDWAGESGPVLALFHGLEGGSSSHYARALASLAAASGWRAVVPHFRGCSGRLNRLPRAYHSGDSDEIDWIVRRLGARHAVGVSLGGNALLKWLGEQGEAAPLERAVAVSAPFDLAAAGDALDRGFNRRCYTRAFLLTLKAKAFAKQTLGHLRFDEKRMSRARTLREFDDMVTAPLHGFRDAADYWARASSEPWLGRIRVPTLLVNARNDPFLPPAVLERVPRDNPSLVLEFPDEGGHAGFPGTDRWMARRVLKFLSST